MTFKGILKFMVKNVLVRNLLLMCLTAALLIWGVMIWLDGYTMHNQAIEVPDLKGMQAEAAETILAHRNLRCQVIDSVYSRAVAPGAVVEQIPAANHKVKENRIIFLTVNARNAQTVSVPDVGETSLRQAVASLKSLGFDIDSIRYVPSDYRDLVLGVFYNGAPISPNQRIPYGAKIMIEAGDGHGEIVAVDTIDEEGTEFEWLQ